MSLDFALKDWTGNAKGHRAAQMWPRDVPPGDAEASIGLDLVRFVDGGGGGSEASAKDMLPPSGGQRTPAMSAG